MRKLPLSIACIILCYSISAQSIGPQVINSTGASFNQPAGNFCLDWNVGEMTLVNTMQGTGGLYVVTNGFLQPTKYGHVKKSDHFSRPAEFTVAEISVYPNPAVSFVELDVRIPEQGRMKVILYNNMGQQAYTREFNTSGSKGNERIPMAGLTAGSYLLSIEFYHTDGTLIRKGSYKIVKTL